MSEIYLPALRGIFGDWVYYSCLISASDLAERVDYVTRIHKSTQLSDLIQRELKEGRSREISLYLEKEKEKFLGSLVVAVYGGDPEWNQASLTPAADKVNREAITDDALNSVGFLKLSGREKLFAIDGQHRLSGIKTALEGGLNIEEEEVNILLVSHKNTKLGRERTRRLFTTLNKKSVRVSKGEIIALDEDDLMAIVVRRLVEENPYFMNDRIAFKATNNISINHDKKSLTTIGNLYDILAVVFGKIKGEKVNELKNGQRPSEEKIKDYYKFTKSFFEKMGSSFPALRKYFKSTKEERVVDEFRGDFGGNVLFRPIGLLIVVEVICALYIKYGQDKAFQKIMKIPVDLNKEPYKNVIWIPSRKIMNPKGKTVSRDMLLVTLGIIDNAQKIREIKKKYNNFLDN